MLGQPGPRWPLYCAILLLVGLVGCRDTALLARPDWWPWGGDPNYEFLNERGQLAPSQRIDQLEELADTAPRQSAEEQRLAALQVAEQIRGELDPLIRLQMVRTLEEIEVQEASTVLAAALSDPDPRVRVEACRVWGRRGGEQAARLLTETLNSDTDKDVRLAALRQLGKVGDIYAVSNISAILENPDPAMQHAAVQALKELTGEDYGNDVAAWQAFVRGENPPKPKRSLAERIPRLWF